MDTLIGLLRLEDTQLVTVKELLGQLAGLLDDCFDPCRIDAVYDDAVQRAPWLTADAERLRQEVSVLRQSLQAVRMLASGGEGSVRTVPQLGSQFNDFVESYLEYEAAKQNFLQTAFPAPDWVMDDSDSED
jgi:hypothetical protein